MFFLDIPVKRKDDDHREQDEPTTDGAVARAAIFGKSRNGRKLGRH